MRATARAQMVRANEFLTKEILFDYLNASVAQKLTDLAQIQLRAKLFKNGVGATNELN